MAGAIAIKKMIIIAVLCFAFVLSLSFGAAAFGFRQSGETAPDFSDTQNNQSVNNCDIPDEYFQVFKNAVTDYPNASVALLAAIFYAGEHGNSWPNINGPWATSNKDAQGPFQFIESTWKDYGTGPFSNAQDINLAARAAANLIHQNYKTQHGTHDAKIKKVIYRYNHSDKYVDVVFAQYQTYMKCLSSKSSGSRYSSLEQVKEYFGSTPAEIQKYLVGVEFMGHDITVNKVMEDDLSKVEKQLNNNNYKIKTVGGYSFRANANDASGLSAHAFGLAIDINAATNPNSERPAGSAERDPSACKHDIPDSVVKAFEENNFFWGARYKDICDPMHFQYGGNWN